MREMGFEEELFFECCRRREQGVSASAATSRTLCAGAVAAGVSTSRRADAQHVPTLRQESAAVSHYFTLQIGHSMSGLR
jgi:hypothetical protein